MLATFFVASSGRPLLIPHALQTLLEQAVPPGWGVQILVAGRPSDPSKPIAESMGARWVDCDTDMVTAKLNRLMQIAEGDLVLLSDDDDLQPRNRVGAAVEAYAGGAAVSCGSSFWDYNTQHGMVMRWSTPVARGLVGTSMSISLAELRAVGGWPPVPSGKDGHLMHRLRKRPYADLGALVAPVCIQHGQNIWPRPVIEKGESIRHGVFHVEGLGTLEECGELHSMAELRALAGARVEKPDPVPEHELLTCSQAGPGQSAFIDGLACLGFAAVDIKGARSALKHGRRVLFHGWWSEYTRLATQYPDLFFALWHSGYTGSDLMGEHATMHEALRTTCSGHGHLLWLEHRDVAPRGATRMVPVWDPGGMRSLAGGPQEKRPGSVLVGFHGKYPSNAKNVLASVAGAAAVQGAELHMGGSSFSTERGPVLHSLLEGMTVYRHPVLARQEAVRLAGRMEVMLHVSTSDTWPYLVMESVYAGTPVVLSDAVAWSKRLPPWAQELCIVRPATSSLAIAEKTERLLASARDRERLLMAQTAVLDELAPVHAERAKKVLGGLGFMKAEPRQRMKSKEKKAKTPAVCDLRELVTVFVISSGEPSLQSCHRHLDRQDCTFRRVDIAGVTPMWRAFQAMLDLCETPYYVQVDADMLLEPWAVRELYAAITAREKELGPDPWEHGFAGVAQVVAWLWDDDVERPIQGVKIYRHDICAKFPYKESISCEQGQNLPMKKAGYQVLGLQLGDQDVGGGTWRRTRDTFGTHYASQTPGMAFQRWQRLMQKHRALPWMGWLGPHVPRLEAKWLKDPADQIAKARYLGCIAGLTGPIPEVELDSTFANLDYQRVAAYVGEYSEGPTELTLYLTDRCNAKCVWCRRQHGGVPSVGDITPGMLCAALDNNPGVRSACLAGFGEPLMHPKLAELVSILRERKIGVGVISNGILLEEKAKEVKALDLIYLSVSLNAVDREGHKACTGTDTWDRVLAGLRAMKGAKFRVGISFVTTRSSLQHVPALLLLAGELGVSFVHLHNVLPHGQKDYSTEVLTSADAEMLEPLRALPGAKLVESWPQLVDLDGPVPRRCASPFISLGIDAKGGATYCRRILPPAEGQGGFIGGWLGPDRTTQIALVTGDRECEACATCFAQWRE